MLTEQSKFSEIQKRHLSLIDSPESKKVLLINNFEKIHRETGSLITRKIDLIEEKYWVLQK